MRYTDTERKEAKAGQRFVGVMLGLILALLLSSCASQGWVVAQPGYSAPVALVHMASEAELHRACGSAPRLGARLEGCAFRYPGQCVIYLGPSADACTLRHELRHCRGEDHPPEQRIDCLLD